ncbi:M20/M25/M40 family metallo-hydrolase [Thalassotalea ganghwensis]
MILRRLSAAITFAVTIPFSQYALGNNISFDQMSNDISYLASDELNGRGNFTKDIDKAAQYISSRFDDIGLKPLNGQESFLQSFTITSIVPETITVTINGASYGEDQLTFASTDTNVSWQSIENISTHFVSEDGDLRATLSKINQLGGQHLVIVNPAHQQWFNRYKAYFSRGLNKLNEKEQGSIVVVLSNETKIDNLNIQATNSITKQTLTNVVGVLPGKKASQENVLFSSHYDHLGRKPDQEGDAIYNGADDNASGTTAVINLAQYYAKRADNQRNLIFAAFTAEEIGGFGSRYFSEQLNPDDIVAMINIEMIGKPSKFGPGQVWMTGMERSNLGEILNQYLKDSSAKIYQDPYPEQNLFYRSDNATLARLGVPAHSFSSTQLDKDEHYHQSSDDLASLDLNSMHQVIENLAIATQGIVDGSITPTRVDKSAVTGHGKIY